MTLVWSSFHHHRSNPEKLHFRSLFFNLGKKQYFCSKQPIQESNNLGDAYRQRVIINRKDAASLNGMVRPRASSRNNRWRREVNEAMPVLSEETFDGQCFFTLKSPFESIKSRLPPL